MPIENIAYKATEKCRTSIVKVFSYIEVTYAFDWRIFIDITNAIGALRNKLGRILKIFCIAEAVLGTAFWLAILSKTYTVFLDIVYKINAYYLTLRMSSSSCTTQSLRCKKSSGIKDGEYGALFAHAPNSYNFFIMPQAAVNTNKIRSRLRLTMLVQITLQRLSLKILGFIFFMVSALASMEALAASHGCMSECTERIGIISAFGAEADILLAQTTSKKTWAIHGKNFTTGTLRGNKVVIVLSGVSMINSALVTQQMLDHFNVERLIMSGIAGGVNPANHVGDVTVPDRWTMPMEVYWNADARLPAVCGPADDVGCLGLKLANGVDGKPLPPFNLPGAPTGLFMRQNYVLNAADAPKGEFRFDYPVDPEMLAVVGTLTPKLERCGLYARQSSGEIDSKQCVSEQPRLLIGGRGVSGTAFLANPFYRAYLFETLQAETVEMETAALAHVALTNGIPYIAFRSLSDLAGATEFNADVAALFSSGLAETNEAAVTLAFLEAWKKHQSHH